MGNNKTSKKLQLDKKNNILNLEQSYESNLPSPEDIKKYESALHGMGKEILEMAKKEQLHRHKRGPKVVNLTFFTIYLVGL